MDDLSRRVKNTRVFPEGGDGNERGRSRGEVARTRTETPPGIDRAWRCTLNNSPRSLRTRRTALLRLTATRSRGIFESYRDTRSRKSTRVMELCGSLGQPRFNNLS